MASAVMILQLVACGGAVAPGLPLKSAAAPSPPPAPKPTCLVLSVGGAAGVAHLGAIEALRANRIEINCVVGNSMGALVGALHAANPSADTTTEFRLFLSKYIAASKGEATARATGVGALGLVLLGPLGALFGGAIGAGSVERLDHDRLIAVLDEHLAHAQIETLPVPFATSFVEPRDQKVAFVEARTGNVAAAVGASVANPFIFRQIDVRAGGPIDPGLDRVSAVPIEQACSTFPEHRMLAVNVMPEPAFVSTRMRCDAFEVTVSAPEVAPEAVLGDPARFDEVVAVGRKAMEAWLATTEGREFASRARHTQGRTDRGASVEPPIVRIDR
jgi:predicted acylesterase/phospholipase RssA